MPQITLLHQLAVSENACVWPPEFPRDITWSAEWRAVNAQHGEGQVQGESQVQG